MTHRAGLVAAVVLVAAVGVAALFWFWRVSEPDEDRLALTPGRFSDLPGWTDDDPTHALAAFLKSCNRLGPRPDDAGMGGTGYAGTVADWRPACDTAAAVSAGIAGNDPSAVRAFFEQAFVPVLAANNREENGLFTGYYEPSLNGSRARQGPFQVPLHIRPPDLITVDLGKFREDLRGRRIAGRIQGGDLVPYADRTAIETGALSGRSLELVWVDNPVDAFFLHIQGSGRVQLQDGGVLRVGYAGQNGHPYVSIGRSLIDRGAVPREEMSMQSIRRWLAENPDAAADLMRENPSYVFFRDLGPDGPLGAQGAVLTPERSLAVDRKFHALGVPVWLDGAAPTPDGQAEQPLRRLMVAQDTGGAIRGPVRGDVFWGHGEDAASVAGRMQHEGRLWFLLPRDLAARLTPSG